MVNVLKSYIDRGSRLEITLEQDGNKLTLNSFNLDTAEIQPTIELLNRFFDAKSDDE